MPAAAVIPAPIAYINFAAVEKLVVGYRVRCFGAALWVVIVAFDLKQPVVALCALY